MPLDAASKARIFKLYRIAVMHACDVEVTVAPFTDFLKQMFCVRLGKNRQFS
jgi:hypothetical protein